MYPECVGTVSEGDARTHGENIRVDGHRKHDGGKDCEHFHGEIEFVRKEGIVRRLERLDDFFVVLENIPEADVRPDKILEIDLQILRDKRTLFLKERFDNRSLRLQCAAEIKNISLDYRNLEYHFLFLAIENAVFNGIEILRDVIKSWKAGAEEHIEDMIHEMCWCFVHENPFLSVVSLEHSKEIVYLKNVIFVSGDEMRFGEDNIHFARIGGAVRSVEKRYVH